MSRLAADLVGQGFPVWLDSWEIELGDSLFDRVFKGIDASTFLLVALSPNSVNSNWVSRELNAALSKEDKLGRKVIIPIKIAACEIPLSIADRIYADFTAGYRIATENLVAGLTRLGAANVSIPFERELLPLRFSKGIYLDTLAVQRRLEKLAPRMREGAKLTAQQVIAVPSTEYDQLRALLLSTIDGLESDIRYTPQFESDLSRMYESIRRSEDALRAGTAELANGLVAINDWAFFYEAAQWFSRLIRSEAFSILDAARQFAGAEALKPPVDPVSNILGSPASAARFFEVERVMACDVYREDSRDYIRIWVDRAGEVGDWFATTPQLHDTLRAFWSPTLIYKFLVPQMLARHFWFSPSTPIAWDLIDRRWRIGAA